MTRLFPRPLFSGIAVAAAACAPAAPARALTPVPAVEGARSVRSADAGVTFIHDMILHHAQALEMAALASERAGSNAVRALATKIRLSQSEEIEQMERWLADRGHGGHAGHGTHAAGHGSDAHAAAHAHGTADHGDMPGMASAAEMERLAAVTGTEFDTLFLELMIRHHEGALTMVDQLFTTTAASTDSELYRIAAEIDSEQRIEIGRMRSVLGTLRR